MDSLRTFKLREPRWDDLPAVAEVLAADDLDNTGQGRPGHGLPPRSVGAIRLRPDDRRLGRSRRRGGGREAPARSHVTRRTWPGSWGVVHPAHRGRGIGSALLARIEARAFELVGGESGARLRHSVNAGDVGRGGSARGPRPAPRPALLAHAHRSPGRARCRPSAGRDRDPHAGTSPHDLPAVHAVLDRAFADHWDHRHEPFERWARGPTRRVPPMTRICGSCGVGRGERPVGRSDGGPARRERVGESAGRARGVPRPRDRDRASPQGFCRLRRSRSPLCASGRRRGEPHGRHGALRERGHERRETIRRLGARAGSAPAVPEGACVAHAVAVPQRRRTPTPGVTLRGLGAGRSAWERLMHVAA